MKLFLALASLSLLACPAYAHYGSYTFHASHGRFCTVRDPNGTPVNYRKTPNGELISSFPHGMKVLVRSGLFDAKDRWWAYAPNYNGYILNTLLTNCSPVDFH